MGCKATWTVQVESDMARHPLKMLYGGRHGELLPIMG